MQNDMVVRGLAVGTQQSYLTAVEGLAAFYHRRPDRISPKEVQRYLTHLIEERQLAYSTCNVVAYALKFFYRITLQRSDAQFHVPAVKKPRRLPEILSREELKQLFLATANVKHRALLMTTYAAGLRVSEVVALRVCDIDSERMTLRVEQGKGQKDRYTLLSQRLLCELRHYWRVYRPKPWLFAGPDSQRPLTTRSAQRLYTKAKRRAGITKRGGIHVLRHAFATALLEAGVDLHTIQRLLGHRQLSTSMRYFHVAKHDLAQTPSPLELLELPDDATG
jgi:site-specific recombinase XerD